MKFCFHYLLYHVIYRKTMPSLAVLAIESKYLLYATSCKIQIKSQYICLNECISQRKICSALKNLLK